MFDMGFPEMLLVAVVVLLVFGPERLPEVLRSVGSWVGAARRSFMALRTELEREVGADDIRRDLHNSRIMEEARNLQTEMRDFQSDVKNTIAAPGTIAAKKERAAALQAMVQSPESEDHLPTAKGNLAADAGPEKPSATQASVPASSPEGKAEVKPEMKPEP